MFNLLDNNVTPLEITVLESNQRANEIIDILEDAINNGEDPNKVDIDYSDVLDDDLDMIKTTIEQYVMRKQHLTNFF